MAVRVSQTNKEIAGASSTPVSRVTQAQAEILTGQANTNARMTQLSTEIISTQAGANVRATQSTVEILLWLNSWMIYDVPSLDESSVPAPTVLLSPPPPPPVFYFYPSGGGKVLKYKPTTAAADSRLLERQRLWEAYARAAVEGTPETGVRSPGAGVRGLGRITNGLRWLEPGRQRRQWMRQGSIITPAPADGDVAVCEFEVPEGYYGYLTGFWWAYTGTGYVEGSTDIYWRIKIGDWYPEGYGAVRFQMGTPTDPLTITGMLPLRSRETVKLIVFVKNDSGFIQVGTSRIIGGLRGWLYEPEGGKGGGVRW